MITGVQLFNEYKKTKTELFNEVFHISKIIEDSISVSLWDFNYEQLDSITLGLSQANIIHAAAITNEKGKIVSIRNIDTIKKTNENVFYQDQDKILKSDNSGIELIYYESDIEFKQNNKIIGKIYLYIKQGVFIDRIISSFAYIILSSLVKTMALWLIFLFYTKKIISKPLGILTESTQQLTQDETDQNSVCELENLIECNKSNDELFTLAKKFIEMREKINEKIFIIKNHNKDLEAKVKERTIDLEKANERLLFLSTNDPLTGLPNRKYFQDRMEQTIELCRRNKKKFCLMIIDFKDFKKINDSYGHLAGDHILISLSGRIKNIMRKSDVICRIGGDEFSIIINDTDGNLIKSVISKINECTKQAITFEETNIMAKVNIGVSIFPDHGRNPEELYKNADLAMYKTKSTEQNYLIYQKSMESHMPGDSSIGQKIHAAIRENKMSWAYGPLFSSANDELTGLIAEIQWQDERINDFGFKNTIDKITDMDILFDFSVIVTEILHNDIKTLSKTKQNLLISIDIPVSLFQCAFFINGIAQLNQTLESSGYTIILGGSDCFFDNHSNKLDELFNQLDNKNIQFSINNLGGCEASLSCASHLPANYLKIGENFLKGLDQKSKSLTEFFIKMAHEAELKTIAIGVENNEHYEQLKLIGCDHIEKNYPASPFSTEQLDTLIANGFDPSLSELTTQRRLVN